MLDRNGPHSQYDWTTAGVGNTFFVFSIRPGNEIAGLATLFLHLYLFKFVFALLLSLYLYLVFVFSVVVFSIRPDNEIDSSLTSFTFPQNWLHLLLSQREEDKEEAWVVSFLENKIISINNTQEQEFTKHYWKVNVSDQQLLGKF